MIRTRFAPAPSWTTRIAGVVAVVAAAASFVASDVAAQPGASASSASAKAPARLSGPTWSSLTPAQQTALAPLQREWASIDAARRSKWLEVAAKFPSMPPAERERIQARMADWSRLTPAERGRARQQFQESRQFPAEDRQARWESYRALPEEQRSQLARRSAPATGSKAGASAPASDGKLAANKRNLVPAATSATQLTKPVTPTAVQVKPGATTTLMSQPAKPPAHQQPGLPKIAATEGFVDPHTLLPKRGPQGAAVRAAASAASSAPPPAP